VENITGADYNASIELLKIATEILPVPFWRSWQIAARGSFGYTVALEIEA
jgi:hypothetical protein